MCAQKGVRFSTLIERAGGWTRGARSDFDEWADLVNDTRWSYDGQLPHLKDTETFWSNSTNLQEHGHSGPLKIEVPSTTGRVFPLRDAVYASYEAVGIEALPGLDANAGNNLGFGEISEVRTIQYFPFPFSLRMVDRDLEKRRKKTLSFAVGRLHLVCSLS